MHTAGLYSTRTSFESHKNYRSHFFYLDQARTVNLMSVTRQTQIKADAMPCAEDLLRKYASARR